MKHILLGCLLIAAQAAFCADAKKTPAKPAPAAEPTSLAGKVTETMNAATYTYFQVDTGKEKVWVAAPQFAVKVGDAVTVGQPMAMRNYQSKTLNRTFDVVYFTGAVTVNGKPTAGAEAPPAGELPKNHPPIPGAAPNPGANAGDLPKGHPPVSGASGPARPLVDVSDVKKAQGGKTVAEIFGEKAKLSGKEVKVRGKVMKYNAQIMGRNWVHIMDGTGAPGSNDLLITTAAEVKVGDTILVTGKVATNRDFGANYKYDVMIEDAKVVVE